MKPISQLKRKTPATFARRAMALIRRNRCESRSFDDCFEIGNGWQVVALLLARYEANPEFARAVDRNNYYINVAHWRERVAHGVPDG